MSAVRSVLVIGCGVIARGVHLPTLRQLGATTIDVVDVVPPHEQGVNYLGQFIPYDGRRYDVALIASPPSSHAFWLQEAAKVTDRILCEKPPTTTLDELRAVMNTVAAHRTVLLFGFHNCFRPSWQFFTTQVRTTPGRILVVEGWYRRRAGLPHQPWHLTPEEGGVWRDLGSHILSLIYDILLPQTFAKVTSVEFHWLPQGADHAAKVDATCDTIPFTVTVSWLDPWELHNNEEVGIRVIKDGHVLEWLVQDGGTITVQVDRKVLCCEQWFGLHPYEAEWQALLRLTPSFKDLRAVWVQQLLDAALAATMSPAQAVAG